MPETNGTTPEKLAKAGLAGICIALIILIAFIINGVFQHIANGTQVMTELRGAIEKSTEVDKDQTEVMRDLERAININLNQSTALNENTDSSLK